MASPLNAQQPANTSAPAGSIRSEVVPVVNLTEEFFQNGFGDPTKRLSEEGLESLAQYANIIDQLPTGCDDDKFDYFWVSYSSKDRSPLGRIVHSHPNVAPVTKENHPNIPSRWFSTPRQIVLVEDLVLMHATKGVNRALEMLGAKKNVMEGYHQLMAGKAAPGDDEGLKAILSRAHGVGAKVGVTGSIMQDKATAKKM